MARLKRAETTSERPTSADTSPAAESTSSPWYRVSGWRLRNKIALALAFPIISAAWFATDKAIESFIVQQSHEATAGQVRVLEPALDFLYAAEDSYVHTLKTPPGSAERRAAAQRVEETAAALEQVSDSESLTDNQRIQIKNIAEWAVDLSDTEVVRVTTATNSQVSQLNSAVTDYFQSIVNGQVVPEASLQQINDVMDGHIALTQQRIYADYDGETIKNQPDLFQYIGIERGAIDSLADARPAGDPDATNLRAQNVQRQAIVVLGEGELRFDPTLELYETINATVLGESLAALDANASEARGKAILNLNILVLSILATLFFAWLIARLILKPVRAVRDGALAVATEQLPNAVAKIRAGQEPDALRPIAVHTHEEMGQLARAVDDLHLTAVSLASGEAKLRSQVGEMFVTLSRRNTSLINQQLGLIEELERDEQDPRRLENLFRLDHLAARMRRTAESLVILSDAPVRQREAAPLAITDALQAATAGVQEYQRVELRGGTDVQVDGMAANDVVHLLTELIDNALSFSPPTAPVQVSTSADPTGVRIEISDGGLGMPADMLNQINTMLAAQVGITPDAARRMGLFVVSRLAQRHSLDVRLVGNNRGGVTAAITVPHALIVGGAAVVSATIPATPPAAQDTSAGSAEERLATDQPPLATVSAVSAVQDAAPAAPPAAGLFDNPLSAPDPVIQPTPFAPKAPAGRDPLSDPLTAPRPDPLSDPLTAPLAARPAPEVSTVPTEGDLLPRRNPGATVPTRVAAVSPTSASLFGSGHSATDDPSTDRTSDTHGSHVGSQPGALFDRPATAAVATPDQASTPDSDPAVMPEPAEAPKVSEPAVFESLPAIDADVPVTPATTDSTVSMFGSPGEETRVAPERTEQDNATVAARMGMFNALARGTRGAAATPAATPAPVSVVVDPPIAQTPSAQVPADVPVASSARYGSSALDGPSILDRSAPTQVEPVASSPAPHVQPQIEQEAATSPGAPTDHPIASAPTTSTPTTPAPALASPLTSASTATPLATEASASDVTEASATVSAIAPEKSSTWLAGTGSPSFSNPAVDAGWAAAEKVAKHVESERTGSGLPQRRPGQRLVPGAAAPTKELPPRDPEAIRRRLASHAAGVSRGRSVTVPTTSRAQEEGQA